MEDGCAVASIVAPDLDRLPATSMANLPTWPLEFFFRKCCRRKCCVWKCCVWKWPATKMFLAVGPKMGFLHGRRKKKMKENENESLPAAAKKKKTQRAIDRTPEWKG